MKIEKNIKRRKRRKRNKKKRKETKKEQDLTAQMLRIVHAGGAPLNSPARMARVAQRTLTIGNIGRVNRNMMTVAEIYDFCCHFLVGHAQLMFSCSCAMILIQF
jgi:hypothetical protein